MTRTTIEDVRDFLARRRPALVGLSRQEKDFSRAILRELTRRGYDGGGYPVSAPKRAEVTEAAGVPPARA